MDNPSRGAELGAAAFPWFPRECSASLYRHFISNVMLRSCSKFLQGFFFWEAERTKCAQDLEKGLSSKTASCLSGGNGSAWKGNKIWDGLKWENNLG